MLATGYTPEQDAVAWEALTDLAYRKEIAAPGGAVYAFDDVPAMTT